MSILISLMCIGLVILSAYLYYESYKAIPDILDKLDDLDNCQYKLDELQVELDLLFQQVKKQQTNKTRAKKRSLEKDTKKKLNYTK